MQKSDYMINVAVVVLKCSTYPPCCLAHECCIEALAVFCEGHKNVDSVGKGNERTLMKETHELWGSLLTA